MSLAAQLSISIVIAIVAATLVTIMKTGGMFDPVTLIAFCIATLVTALIVRSGAGTAPKPARAKQSASNETYDDSFAEESSEDRETGQVKWFNISKGFGFIVKEDGEEIFVHFRSIRGEGRRSLQDGQAVSFFVTDSDKGPQAEDVVGL